MDTSLFLTFFLFAVQTAAGVAPMRWPQCAWLAGIIFWLSSVFAALCLIYWILSNRDDPMSLFEPRNIIAIGLAIAIAGLIWLQVGGGTKTAALKSPDITWNFNNSPPGNFLGLAQNRGEAARFQNFQAAGKNNLATAITNFSGYIRSEITNKTMPIFINVLDTNGFETPVKQEDTFGMPPLAEFSITTWGAETPPEITKDGEPISKFISEFGKFTLVFEYDGKKYERRFSPEEIKKQVDDLGAVVGRDKTTAPRVLRKPKV